MRRWLGWHWDCGCKSQRKQLEIDLPSFILVPFFLTCRSFVWNIPDGFAGVLPPSSEVSLGGNGMCAAADGCWGAVTHAHQAWICVVFKLLRFRDPVSVPSICTDGFEHFQLMWLSCLQWLLFSCFLVALIVSLTMSVFCSPPFHILFDVLAYLANILFHPCTRDTFLCSILSLGRTKSCLFYVMCDGCW